jgi:murein L,D-transpeptidase YcbB/YkuD
MTAAATGLLVIAATIASAAATVAPLELQQRLDGPLLSALRTQWAPKYTAAVREFYARRGYRPLWIGQGLSTHGDALRATLSRASEHGLDPAAYRVPEFETRGRVSTAAEPDLELALTYAYLEYATDVLSGVIDNPRAIGRVQRDSRRPDPLALLEGIANAPNPAAYLARLWPDGRRYNALKTALAKYRQIERNGGWPIVAGGPTLKPGAHAPRVAQVKQRLLVTGDLARLGDSEFFDEELAAAIRKFQNRHGLKDDGTIGADTVAAMNVPVKERIEQIVINLERRRWLAAHLGDRYLYLNIADNDVKLVDKDRTIHTARVIVGKPYQQTPVFSAAMIQIEINPYWNVPRSIAVNELWPIFRRNHGYAAANDYIIDGTSIRQKPGPKNALGTIAFRFPNPYNVYLHDTPAKSLFDRESRYFSHGCMRLEFPMKLALLLLTGQDSGIWTEQRINSIITTRVQTFVNLKSPIAIHITYLTAWAERDGTVHFRPDVYRRDPALKQAMRRSANAR